MSLFETWGTPKTERRTLFWLVCILVRLLLATTFTTFTFYGPEWVAYVVGGIGILGGMGFWYRKVTDNGDNIWWHRVVHGFVWIAGGTASITTRYFKGPSIAAATVGAFFFFDVLFGVGTALFPERNPWANFNGERLLSDDANTVGRFVNFKGSSETGGRTRLCGASDNPAPAWITKWSLVHLILSSVAGTASFFLDRGVFSGESLWAICLLASFGILFWEFFENTHLEFKEKYLGNKRIDSDANFLGDILVGFAGLWGTAYILKAAVA